MQSAAPAFALARFAFWIQTEQSHASFRLIKRIEGCDTMMSEVLISTSRRDSSETLRL
jgi:hypothetical protein